MKRAIVVANDDCGIRCPRQSLFQRCGQFHCPINCHMSAWSGWSKCTAECGGGLQSHTRSILVKPKNGGLPCNTPEDSRPCATGSCDRNCRLGKWTAWTPCSMDCGGGFHERVRHVVVPTRGYGKCPKDTSRYRYGKGSCNTQACVGDEICIAHQDLVLALDGSGSLLATGFDILKKFAKTLLGRYQTEYFGAEAVKIGVVLFGNGVVMPDGKTVSPAILSQPLTFDMNAVVTAVTDLPFKKGFTNMAQAFSAAETAFIQGSRQGAQSAVMLITDGMPSFNFMTTQMVEKLEDKGIQRYFMVVSEESLTEEPYSMMRDWASQPWETNLIHVAGGLAVLDADTDVWADKAIVKFCPMAHSPSELEWQEANYGYAHVKDGGYCGALREENLLTTEAGSVEQCAALVAGAGGQSFIFGVSFAGGKCYLGTLSVDEAQFSDWRSNKINPSCPEEGGWHTSALFDFYAMETIQE